MSSPSTRRRSASRSKVATLQRSRRWASTSTSPARSRAAAISRSIPTASAASSTCRSRARRSGRGRLSRAPRRRSDDANRTATAVLVTLEMDFPVPIALGSSGLGIYGFGGLFAAALPTGRALQRPGARRSTGSTRVNGNPIDITGWTPEIDHWAIGLGAVLGTMDAGFMLNVKGMLIFEMPGPRILLVMKAKIIWIRPPRKGNVTATILAVIDIDLGRGRITIGLTFDYDIKPLLQIHVPVRAIFPFNDLPHFAIDVGKLVRAGDRHVLRPVHRARLLHDPRQGHSRQGRTADNYDTGQSAAEQPFPLPCPLGGFSITTGVSVSFVWGSRGSGLYLSVGASIDVGIGFAPIMFAGHLRLWGELHLWIVGIEASAQLTVMAGQVPDGPMLPDPSSGRSDAAVPADEEHRAHRRRGARRRSTCSSSASRALFTSPSATIRDSPPAPPPLVTGVSLQSRAAALLQRDQRATARSTASSSTRTASGPFRRPRRSRSTRSWSSTSIAPRASTARHGDDRQAVRLHRRADRDATRPARAGRAPRRGLLHISDQERHARPRRDGRRGADRLVAERAKPHSESEA